jgi:hypothetical protein
MMQIIGSTDGKFIGLVFDPEQPLILNGAVFVADQVDRVSVGIFRFSNSSYVIDVKEI